MKTDEFQLDKNGDAFKIKLQPVFCFHYAFKWTYIFINKNSEKNLITPQQLLQKNFVAIHSLA